MRVYHDEDVDMDILKGRTIAVIGYGSQGRAQALNMRESGLEVVIGVRRGPSWGRAEKDGFQVHSVSEAAEFGEIIVMLIPDMAQPKVYEGQIRPHLDEDKTLQFAHGFNIHFGRISPPEFIDVIMVAPKAPGPEMRRQYEAGFGVPALIAVHQDHTGEARAKALAMARAIGSGRVGILETTFREETESDLFGEQAVLCGGVDQLIRRGFKVLVEAGYPPELAYFEVLNELKLIVDLIYKQGISGMYRAVSETARYGGLSVGPSIIDDHVEENMRRALRAVRDGSFAERWIDEYEGGCSELRALLEECEDLEIERVGREVRRMASYEGR